MPAQKFDFLFARANAGRVVTRKIAELGVIAITNGVREGEHRERHALL
ncbi:MAG: hypothetical protein ACK5Y2_01445 [Bdellovibrionales bacterium]